MFSLHRLLINFCFVFFQTIWPFYNGFFILFYFHRNELIFIEHVSFNLTYQFQVFVIAIKQPTFLLTGKLLDATN